MGGAWRPRRVLVRLRRPRRAHSRGARGVRPTGGDASAPLCAGGPSRPADLPGRRCPEVSPPPAGAKPEATRPVPCQIAASELSHARPRHGHTGSSPNPVLYRRLDGALRDVTARGRSQDAAEVSPGGAEAVGRAQRRTGLWCHHPCQHSLGCVRACPRAIGTATCPPRLIQAGLKVPSPGEVSWGAAGHPGAELGGLTMLCWSCCSHW